MLKTEIDNDERPHGQVQFNSYIKLNEPMPEYYQVFQNRCTPRQFGKQVG